MSDPITLIPNLQEVMEECIESEIQTEQNHQAEAGHVENRDNENETQQQTGEESRKRKRGTNEAGAEKRKDIARNFVSERATTLMEESLKERGFIVERGFKKAIYPFAEVLEKRGWQSLGEHRELGCASLVKKLFVNMVEKEGKKVYVRGHWVVFGREEIKRLFNLHVQKDGAKFKKQIKEPKIQKIVDLLTAGKGEWKGTKKTPCRSISRGDLTEEAKVWFYFIKSVLLPSKHLSIVRREEAILLYALLKGYKINVGKIIEKSILGYSEGNCRGMIPHLGTITRLCIQGGVDEEWGIEETYPRASPLTLTGVTKGPKNRGKGEKKKKQKKKRGMKDALSSNNGKVQVKYNKNFRKVKPILECTPRVKTKPA